MYPGRRTRYPTCSPRFSRSGYSVALLRPFRSGSHVLDPDSSGFHCAVRSGTVELSWRSLQQTGHSVRSTEDRSGISLGGTRPAMTWRTRDSDRDERSTR